MKLDNTKAQMRKGLVELCVLSMIAKQKRYAGEILNELKDTELLVVEGTVYPILNRLNRDGMLSYEWEESNSGPPRKYFTVTDQGKESLELLTKSWKKFSKAINQHIVE